VHACLDLYNPVRLAGARTDSHCPGVAIGWKTRAGRGGVISIVKYHTRIERSDFLLELEMFVDDEELNESTNKEASVRERQEKQGCVMEQFVVWKVLFKKTKETSH
jgi:hypothetical protein